MAALNMYAGIKALILALPNNVYPANTIMQAYQNGVTLPTNDQFVIMTLLSSTSQAMMPQFEYDAILETDTYDNVNSNNFQVDFYANTIDIAMQQSYQFQIAVQSAYGTNFLYFGYGCSVHGVKEVMNLTDALDRALYTPRFTVRFSLFSNNTLTLPSLGFDYDNPNIRLAEVQ